MASFVQKCIKCGSEFPPLRMSNRCTRCGGIIKISYGYRTARKKLSKRILRTRSFNLWRYGELLPIVRSKNIVSLGEGGTPLIRSSKFAERVGLRRLHLKDETRLPTGSLKDRCATVSISKALESGEHAAVISSSGNAAASMSAYSARAGIRCYVFVPSNAPSTKLIQSLSFGAKVVRVNGTTGNSVDMAREVGRKKGWVNVSTAATYNPYAMEGQKTAAYEIMEQLGWKAPDWLIVPVGSGNGLAGQWAGFKDFVEMGFIDKLPRIGAVQAAGCAPFTDAVEKGLEPSEVRAWEKPDTIAGGVRDEYPYDVELALPAFRESRGAAVKVTDREIVSTMKMLGRDEGIFSEPTGAVAAAGVRRLVESKAIDSDETVVAMVTGSGLKDPSVLSKEFPEPPVVDPDVDEILKLL